MLCHNHEAITTVSPLPGQAALREESGCSPRNALPGPGRLLFGERVLLPPESDASSSSTSSTSSSSCWLATLRVYHRRFERYMQAGKTHHSCIFPSSFTIDTSGRALGCCGGVLRRRVGGPRGVHKLSRHTSECDRVCTSIAIPNHMHRLVVIASGPALCSTLRNVQYPSFEVFF